MLKLLLDTLWNSFSLLLKRKIYERWYAKQQEGNVTFWLELFPDRNYSLWNCCQISDSIRYNVCQEAPPCKEPPKSLPLHPSPAKWWFPGTSHLIYDLCMEELNRSISCKIFMINYLPGDTHTTTMCPRKSSQPSKCWHLTPTHTFLPTVPD